MKPMFNVYFAGEALSFSDEWVGRRELQYLTTGGVVGCSKKNTKEFCTLPSLQIDSVNSGEAWDFASPVMLFGRSPQDNMAPSINYYQSSFNAISSLEDTIPRLANMRIYATCFMD